MNIFNELLIKPITNLVFVFYQGFSALHIPGALGFSIVIVTVLIRLAINPLLKKQMDQSREIQELQPLLTKIQNKYKGEPAKLQQAQAELYKEKKINPGFGCLIFIIQMPIFIGLYTALSQLVTTTGGMAKAVAHLNSLLYHPSLQIKTLDIWFFGLQLDKMPNAWQKIGWWYLLIPVLTGVLQFYQSYLTSKSMAPIMPSLKPEPDKKTKALAKNQKIDDKKKDEPNFSSIMQKEMMIIFPLMIGWAAYNFPVGLSIYWNIFTIFGIFQYLEQAKIQAATNLKNKKDLKKIKS